MQNKKPSVGGVWIFSGTAQLDCKQSLSSTKFRHARMISTFSFLSPVLLVHFSKLHNFTVASCA